MSALLVLLLLLSVATVASRPGAASAFFDRVATPLLVVVGLVCAPSFLGVMSSSMIEALRPGLAVGVTWLAVLTGLRSSTSIVHSELRSTVRAALVVVLSTLASVALATLALMAPELLGLRDPAPTALLAGAALVIGGALVGSPLDDGQRAEEAIRSSLANAGDLVAMSCAVLALAVLPPWSPLPPSLAAAAVVGSGLLLAVVQRLAGGSARGDPATRTIAILGVVAVGAGVLHAAGLPSAVSGLVAGAALARSDVGRALRMGLRPTERPARIVIVFLVGTMLSPSVTALIIGVLLALSQLVIQLIATSWAVGHRISGRALTTGLSSSSTPLLVAASYALAGLPEGELLLATVTVAVVTTDLLSGGLSLSFRLFGNGRSRSGTTASPTPLPSNGDAHGR